MEGYRFRGQNAGTTHGVLWHGTRRKSNLDRDARHFGEVTKIPEAQIPVEGVEHVIETTKDPPFGPIYNLSETEDRKSVV